MIQVVVVNAGGYFLPLLSDFPTLSRFSLFIRRFEILIYLESSLEVPPNNPLAAGL